MTETCVPVKRTVVTMPDYMRAVVKSWGAVDAGPCTKGACAVLWAQYMIETGGAACWNFNVGNVKHVTGDGHDYHMLGGVWEGVSPVTADNIIAAGHAIRDTNMDHAKAVGKGRVSIIYQPPHPATWFRAFTSLDVAMADHLTLLHKRFAPAWPAVIAGDVNQFAQLLHDHGYFTASPVAYAAGMQRPYLNAMVSNAWDDAQAALAVTQEAETMPALDAPDSEDVVVIHADPSTYLGNGPPDDVA